MKDEWRNEGMKEMKDKWMNEGWMNEGMSE